MFKLKLKFVFWVFFLSGVPFYSFAQLELTIDMALNIAEENYPSLRNSKLSYERSQYNLEAQRAALKSNFSLNVTPFSYSQTRRFDEFNSEWYTNKSLSSGSTFQVRQPVLLTGGSVSLVNSLNWQSSETENQKGISTNEKFTNNLSLQLNQPLFTYNRTKMELRQLEFSLENAGISYALQRLNMESRITSRFYNVYLLQNRNAISREEFENAKKNYQIIKDKADADLITKDELYQAEINLANAESSFEQSTVNLQNAKDNFKLDLGIPLNEDFTAVANIAVKPIIIDTEKAVESGLTSRMEIRQREISLEQEEMAMIQVKARNEFRGDLTVSLGITGDNQNFGQVYASPTQSPSISVGFNIPIFDWGEKKARIKAQETTQKITEMDFETMKLTMENDIRQAVRNLNNLRMQILIEEKKLANTQRTYELNEIRYRAGDVTGMQMNLFQVQLSNAKTSFVSLQINYKNELLSLKILTLYDFENDVPILPIRELNKK